MSDKEKRAILTLLDKFLAGGYIDLAEYNATVKGLANG